MTLNELIHTLCTFVDTHPDLRHHTCAVKAGNMVELVIIESGEPTVYILGAPL